MASMTPRERVVTALNHQEPDRVPIALGGTAHKISDDLFTALCTHFGIRSQPTRVLTGISFTYHDGRQLYAALSSAFHGLAAFRKAIAEGQL